jgi:hypothetical protein
MYIILNGMFFTGQQKAIVLIQKPKLLAMTQAKNSSGSASINPGIDLIEACRRGDYQAQLQIYKLYYKTTYSICLQIDNDPVKAEEIMHESFLSAFENISSYHSRISFSSWLNSFIKNNL